jgi:hypothetical protein
VTAEKRTLAAWTIGIALLAALSSIGGSILAFHGDAFVFNVRGKQPAGPIREVQDKQLRLLREAAPARAATLLPYAAAALAVALSAAWVRRDEAASAWLVRAAAAAIVLRIALGVVEARLAVRNAGLIGEAMEAGVKEGSGGRPISPRVETVVRAAGEVGSGAAIAASVGWCAAVCCFYGFVAHQFWPRRDERHAGPR